MKLTTNNNNKQATPISYKDDFPTLLNTNKNKKQQSNNNNNKFSFASALNNEEKNVVIKEQEAQALAQALALAKPGWVSIKRINGKIHYQYGEMTDAYVNMLLEKQKYERRLEKIYFKRRLEYLQRERDIINDLLGDLSPYYGTRFYNNNNNEGEGEEEEEKEEIEKEEKKEIWTYV